jgi:hypothetical protein
MGGAGGSVPPCPSGANTDPSWANWPMPNNGALPGEPHQASYSIKSGAVVDGVTGLHWEPSPHLVVRLAKAEEYCSGVTLAGLKTWRVPTLIELISIVDTTRHDPAYNTDAFQPVAPIGPQFYWSSSTVPGAGGYQIAVDFTTGSTTSLGSLGQAYVRCVAGPAHGAP